MPMDNNETNHMQSAIVLNLGTELAQGFVANTNAHWIADELRKLGFELLWQATLPDDQATFRSLFQTALQASPDLLLLTGGLGPTDDDLTRQLVAEELGLALELRPEVEQGIRAYVASKGFPWNDSNQVQAILPRGAVTMANPVGTAPGFHLTNGATRIACMPGVPFEMRRMFSDYVPSWSGLGHSSLSHLDCLFAGIGESVLGQGLRRAQLPADVRWCSLPNAQGVLVRFHRPVSGSVQQQLFANALPDPTLQAALRALLQELGQDVSLLVSTDGTSLPETTLRLLAKQGHTLSTAESCTGGLVGAALTSVPGSSAVFLGGITAYDNAAKERLLSVDHSLLAENGAVSEAVACAMAQGVRSALGTTWGIATTGIAGPDGGSAEKPVGTVWMAIAGPNGCEATMKIFGGDRNHIRERSVHYLLNTLRIRVMSTQKITCSFEQ